MDQNLTCFTSGSQVLSLPFEAPSRLVSISNRKREGSPIETSTKKPRNYQRYPKPPYSYVGMIITAIESTPEKNITLSELTASLQTMFSFFSGSYKGWKDSIRHTLSSSPCFIRTEVKRNSTSVWRADLTKAPSNVFKRQDTDVSRGGEWAPTLHEQLDLPPIQLPKRQCPVLTDYCMETTPLDSSRPSRKSPDFNFSIDNILTTVDQPEHDDDSRRRLSFSYDSPVFNTRTIKISRRNKPLKSSQVELHRMISDQAASWGITNEQAIENLSLLCNSISSFSSAPIVCQPPISPSAIAQHPSPQSCGPPTSVSYSPMSATTQFSPASLHSQFSQSYYMTPFHVDQHSNYYNTSYEDYHQQPAFLVDTRHHTIEPLELSHSSPVSISSVLSTSAIDES